MESQKIENGKLDTIIWSEKNNGKRWNKEAQGNANNLREFTENLEVNIILLAHSVTERKREQKMT